jgi:hypothetical protein
MKINLPFHFQLKLSKQYKPIKTLLPIGCDCHPAYMLSKLELRKESFPFDWLDTVSHKALEYTYQNIKSDFNFFLADLKKNNQGKVFAEKYPEALFYHFDDLIENNALQQKINKRIQKFIKLYQQTPCYFVHTITSKSLQQTEDLEFIIQSISNFKTLLKSNDELLIYLRFDESLAENVNNAKILEKAICSLSNVKMISYVREKDMYGIWGDERQYKQLITSLGIKTKQVFPKIVFKRIT